MEILDQTRADLLVECKASDQFPEIAYIVYASLRDETNDGWAWLSLPDYPSRTLIEIRNGRRKVFCEYRKIDENFRKHYNDNPRTIKINSMHKKCCALVLNAWYRDALGIKTSSQQRSDTADVETQHPVQLQITTLRRWSWRSLRLTLSTKTDWQPRSDSADSETEHPVHLQIKPLRLWGWRSLRVTSHHPNIVVRLATRLSVLGAWLGITSIMTSITPLLLDKHHYTAMATCAAWLGLTVAGVCACRGVEPPSPLL
jgi:hypothetical protein